MNYRHAKILSGQNAQTLQEYLSKRASANKFLAPSWNHFFPRHLSYKGPKIISAIAECKAYGARKQGKNTLQIGIHSPFDSNSPVSLSILTKKHFGWPMRQFANFFGKIVTVL